MRVIDLALKDMLQIVRDRQSAIFMLVMPIVFTMFFGIIFNPGSGSGEDADRRLLVGILNLDVSGDTAAYLESLIDGSEAIRPETLGDVNVSEARRLVRDEELMAVVVVPPGFSEDALSGGEPKLDLIVDEAAQSAMTVRNAANLVISRLLASIKSARLSMEALEDQEGFKEVTARQAYLEEGLTLAIAAWENPPVSVNVSKSGQTITESQSGNENPNTQSSPGMLVQFTIFGLIGSAIIFVIERKSRALDRMLTTPTTIAEIIGGHFLAMFAMILLQEFILIAFGQFALSVDYMRVTSATLLMMTTVALWAASLGLLIGVISRTEEQVIMYSLIAMFILAPMGGAWFPLDVTGETFVKIAHITPTAWAMDGFQNIIIRGLGFQSVLLPAGILFAYALLFFGIAIWQFQRMMAAR